MSEWADEYRKLSGESSSEPGSWVTARAEYQRGIMDAVSDPEVETVVFMSSSQVGKTEIVNNIVGFHIHQDPCPIFVIQPTLELAETWSKTRLAPMVEDTPVLAGKVADAKGRSSGNTIKEKTFPGGYVVTAGANSPSSLASRPIRILLCDEIDRYPVSAGAEGDPVSLAKKRTTTFWNKKIVLISTPTVKGASPIGFAYGGSDQRRFFVPCPHCGEYQVLKWGGKDESYGVKWEGRGRDVAYLCEFCTALIDERYRLKMIASGEWRATAISDHAKTVGFHLSELYSPWVTWSSMVADFLEKKKSPERLKVFVNTSLGETFEEVGEGLEPHELQKRQGEYLTEEGIPEGVLLVTAGVDVQDDRLELEFVGWGIGEESWGIDYVVLNGDPAQAGVWEQLDDQLARRFENPLHGEIGVHRAAVDSSYMTDTVYKYAQRRRAVVAVQGQSSQTGKARPIVEDKVKKTKKGRYLPVGVDAAKDLIYARLKKIKKPGAGYMHFPDHYEMEYFEQLTSEKKLTKWLHNRPVKYWFLPKGQRNEALDCRVYALAALRFSFRGSFERLKAKRDKKATERAASVVEEKQEDFTHRLAKQHRKKVTRKPRKKGFVHGY